MWRKLSDAEWHSHHLNKFRGWLAAIILLNCLGIVVVEIDLWFLVILPDSVFAVTVPGRPVSADKFVLTVEMLGTALCLYAIWTRKRHAPEIYLSVTLVMLLVSASVEALWVDPELWLADLWSPEILLLIAISMILFVVAPVMYLFIGARPNVVFKRRVRVAA